MSKVNKTPDKNPLDIAKDALDLADTFPRRIFSYEIEAVMQDGLPANLAEFIAAEDAGVEHNVYTISELLKTISKMELLLGKLGNHEISVPAIDSIYSILDTLRPYLHVVYREHPDTPRELIDRSEES